MRRSFRILRTAAAAGLLLAAAAVHAAFPPAVEEAVAGFQSAYQRAVRPGEQADLHRELLASVLDRLSRNYATEVDLPAFLATAASTLDGAPAGAGDPAEVFKKAINTALRKLDNYSRYLDPRTQASERADSTGSFGGVGLQVEAGEGAVRVTSAMPGTPAERAGIVAGDLILQIDGQPMEGVPLADAIARMRGEPGTPVVILVRRAGIEQAFTVALTRDTIKRQVVRASVEGDMLVLRLGTFTATAAGAIDDAIADANRTHSPRGIVLDLRGNGGGVLREAVKIADTFLARGDIVSLRGRTPSNQRTWQADGDERLAGVPMVVLLDARSASASELVAAALQEHGRAVVMGQRSFGKGTVQTTYSLGENKGALKLTTAIYHGPLGGTVQKVGVMPDIELVNGPVLAVPTQMTAQTPASRTPQARIDQGRCASVLKAADPALSCALAYLQATSVEGFMAVLPAVAPAQPQ